MLYQLSYVRAQAILAQEGLAEPCPTAQTRFRQALPVLKSDFRAAAAAGTLDVCGALRSS